MRPKPTMVLNYCSYCKVWITFKETVLVCLIMHRLWRNMVVCDSVLRIYAFGIWRRLAGIVALRSDFPRGILDGQCAECLGSPAAGTIFVEEYFPLPGSDPTCSLDTNSTETLLIVGGKIEAPLWVRELSIVTVRLLGYRGLKGNCWWRLELIQVNTGWLKKMDSISYFYISRTVHGMWMIYITFKRGGPKFSNTTARVLV